MVQNEHKVDCLENFNIINIEVGPEISLYDRIMGKSWRSMQKKYFANCTRSF